MPDTVEIEVRTGKGTVRTDSDGKFKLWTSFTDTVEIIRRIPRQHARWQSVTYKGKRYQLFGGVHTNYFICLDDPIHKRK